MQNFNNHVRFYTPHHFVFYPIALTIIIVSITGISRHPEHQGEYLLLSGLALLVTWFSFMTRQHYALTLQNRIILLEMRWRYHVLTGKRLESLEDKLSFRQIIALRFASDEELPVLTERAIQEQLSPKQIKQSIKNWVPDNNRV